MAKNYLRKSQIQKQEGEAFQSMDHPVAPDNWLTYCKGLHITT